MINIKSRTHFKISAIWFTALIFFAPAALAQKVGKMPSLPSSGNLGISGSVGAGFTDFSTQTPKDDFQIDRGAMSQPP
ncbi:MAG: hypothetical protein HC902_03290 [Calothrix sp. SM1_5_4]|nr:hypothetical protein [Calothrix sp. SM1_5_4]